MLTNNHCSLSEPIFDAGSVKRFGLPPTTAYPSGIVGSSSVTVTSTSTGSWISPLHANPSIVHPPYDSPFGPLTVNVAPFDQSHPSGMFMPPPPETQKPSEVVVQVIAMIGAISMNVACVSGFPVSPSGIPISLATGCQAKPEP